MIFDMQSLKIKYKDYQNINQKVSLETKNNHLVRIKRGLYCDNLNIDAPVVANICYGPSYLSFEYALSYYGLIPEYVSMYTSACYNKKNNKLYNTHNYTFEYRSIPDEVFPYGIVYLKNEEGISYKIACKEKALCDMLYVKYPIRSIKDLKIALFDDLRIDENEFVKLDFDFINNISKYYHCNALIILCKYIKGVKKYGANNIGPID